MLPLSFRNQMVSGHGKLTTQRRHSYSTAGPGPDNSYLSNTYSFTKPPTPMLILSKYLYHYEVPATVLLTALPLHTDTAANDGWLNYATEVARYTVEQEWPWTAPEVPLPCFSNRLAASLGSRVYA